MQNRIKRVEHILRNRGSSIEENESCFPVNTKTLTPRCRLSREEGIEDHRL